MSTATYNLDLCPHDHRPGTTVCLHCRHAAIMATRARRRKFLLQLGAGLLIVVGLASGGTIGTYADKGYFAEMRGQPRARESFPQQAGAVKVAAASEPVPRAAVNAPPRVGSARQLMPILAVGETRLADSMRAVRADSMVTVFFDVSMIRTRRPEKFERLVRSTLPEIYGPAVDSLLNLVPKGSIVGQGDLLTELPLRGARIALANGWKLTVWPEIRPGFEGPLVVRYRVLAE